MFKKQKCFEKSSKITFSELEKPLLKRLAIYIILSPILRQLVLENLQTLLFL